MTLTVLQREKFDETLTEFALKHGLTASIDHGKTYTRVVFTKTHTDFRKYYFVDWDTARSLMDAVVGIISDMVTRFTYGSKAPSDFPEIKKVIFNGPATIVFWADGTKTVVKCQGKDVFDPEKGLAMAISKRALGNRHDYYSLFKDLCAPWYEKRDLECSDDAEPYRDIDIPVFDTREDAEKCLDTLKEILNEYWCVPVFDTREDAEKCLDTLKEILNEYWCVTVADLYDYVGVESGYKDFKYGWTNLERSIVFRSNGGYALYLPLARPIKAVAREDTHAGEDEHDGRRTD